MRMGFVLLAIVALSAVSPAQTPFEKVMITEVVFGTGATPFAVEISNYDHSSVDVSGWTVAVAWHDGTVVRPVASQTIGAGNTSPATSLDERERLVVTEQPGSFAGVNAAVSTYSGSAAMPTNANAVSIMVTLIDAGGNRVDDVLISNDDVVLPSLPAELAALSGTAMGTSDPVSFNGYVLREAASVRVERLGNLDSDGGDDWTEEQSLAPFNIDNRIGTEKISSGTRGWDPRPVPELMITEIHAPGSAFGNYIEIYNAGATPQSLDGMFFLISETNGTEFEERAPFGTGATIQPGEYIVIGDSPTEPSTGYTTTQSQLTGSPLTQYFTTSPDEIPLDEEEEFSVFFYDADGQVIDGCRCGHKGDSHFCHNSPRAPAHSTDFFGWAKRGEHSWLTSQGQPGDESLGRVVVLPAGFTGSDSNTGADWLPMSQRSLGGANGSFTSFNPNAIYPFFASETGLSDAVDVRVEQPAGLNAFTLIANAGPAYAGATLSLFIGVDPGTSPWVHGGGPLLGLTGVTGGLTPSSDPLNPGNLLGAGPVLTLDARGMGGLFEIPLDPEIFTLEMIATLTPSSAGPGGSGLLRTFILGWPNEEEGHGHP